MPRISTFECLRLRQDAGHRWQLAHVRDRLSWRLGQSGGPNRPHRRAARKEKDSDGMVLAFKQVPSIAVWQTTPLLDTETVSKQTLLNFEGRKLFAEAFAGELHVLAGFFRGRDFGSGLLGDRIHFVDALAHLTSGGNGFVHVE